MAVSPTGIICKPIDQLADMLAASSNFQTWTSSANASEAAGHIWPFEVDDDDDSPTRPFAIIGYHQMRRTLQDARFTYHTTRTMGIWFEAAVGTDDGRDARITIGNKVGPILEDMEALSGSGTNPVLANTELALQPGLSHVRSGERISFCVLEMDVM